MSHHHAFVMSRFNLKKRERREKEGSREIEMRKREVRGERERERERESSPMTVKKFSWHAITLPQYCAIGIDLHKCLSCITLGFFFTLF